MSNVSYIGFDNYSNRFCFVVEFKSKFDIAKFIMNFNGNFQTLEIQAEPDKFNDNTVKVVFVNERDSGTVKLMIDKLINND